MRKMVIPGLFALSLSAAAQQPFPAPADLPVWNVLQCELIDGPWCSTVSYHYSGSAEVCGHSYGYAMEPWGGLDTIYMRNEGPRTRFRIGSDCLDKEYLMYDFSLSIGDTVYPGGPFTAGFPADTALFIVASIDTITQQGVARRRFSMTYDLSNGTDPWMVEQMDWVEGVGSTTHPFYAAECLTNFLCWRSYQLLCYDSLSVNLYLDAALNTCDTILIPTAIGQEGEDRGTFVAHWDPASGELAVRFSPARAAGNLRFMLIAMDGKSFPLRFAGPGGNGEHRMLLPGLADGIYMVYVSDEHGMVASRRVFIQ